MANPKPVPKDMSSRFPSWTHSIKVATENFESWAEDRLADAMTELSQLHRNDFMEPMEHVGRQLSQSLQDSRGRLSERALKTLGVPLRTKEIALRTKGPNAAPGIRSDIGELARLRKPSVQMELEP